MARAPLEVFPMQEADGQLKPAWRRYFRELDEDSIPAEEHAALELFMADPKLSELAEQIEDLQLGVSWLTFTQPKTREMTFLDVTGSRAIYDGTGDTIYQNTNDTAIDVRTFWKLT